MAMIGEELMALLGMIPVRDRAGIARGNLAQETVANAAATEQLPERGPPIAPAPQRAPIAIPPDVTLPDDVPVGYASAKSPVSTAIPPNSRIVQNAVPEPDTTRTIASAPPAATAQMDEMLARVQRANAIRSAIGGFQQAFGGGGGDGGGTQVAGGIDTKDITDMFKTRELLLKADEDRRAAVQASQLRERMITDMMDRRGWSRARAEGAIASGEAKDVYSQDKNKSYYEDQLKEKTRQKILGDPELLKAHAAQAGLPVEVFRTQLERGELLGSKDLSEIGERTQKTAITGADFGVRAEGMKNPEAIAARLSARLGRTVDPDEVRLAAATDETWKTFVKETTEGGQTEIRNKAATANKANMDATKTAGEVRTANIASLSRADVRDNPEKYVSMFKGVTADQLKLYAQSDKAWEKFQEGQAPSLGGAPQQEYWTTYVPQKLAAGETPKGFDEWKKEQTKAGVTPPEDTIRTTAARTAVEELNKSEQKARAASVALAERHRQQELWTPTLKSGGYGAENQENLRLTMARLFNRPDEEASDSKVFFSALKRSMQASGKNQAGPLSDKDITFLGELEGGRALDPNGIRQLQIIHEKALRYDMQEHNQYYDQKTSMPALATLKEFYSHQELPGPGRFIKEDLAESPKAIETLMKNPTPKEIRDFNKEFGHGNAEWIIAHDGKLE